MHVECREEEIWPDDVYSVWNCTVHVKCQEEEIWPDDMYSVWNCTVHVECQEEEIWPDDVYILCLEVYSAYGMLGAGNVAG